AAREADAAVDIMAQFDTPFMMRVVEADQAFLRAAAGGPIPEAIGKLEEVIEGQDAGDVRYKTHLPDIYAGTLHLWNGDAISAIRHLEHGVELARAQTRVAHLAEALTVLGHARLANGDPAGAGQALKEGLQLLESVHVAPTPAKADATVGLGRVALANGDADVALAYLEDADQFWAEFDPGNRSAGIAAYWLGQAQAALDRPDEAGASFARAQLLLAQSPLPADNRLLAGIDTSQVMPTGSR
ncbi:MAG TPA: tetratricopeptide repeat protein, partial [Woeseiaceae bacterium]